MNKRTSEQHVNEKFNSQGFKAHANSVLLWLWINAVSRECNSTTEVTFDVNVTLSQCLVGVPMYQRACFLVLFVSLDLSSHHPLLCLSLSLLCLLFSPFENITFSTFILLIVNISVAADDFYIFVTIVLIWRLNLTWKTASFQHFFKDDWKEEKPK